MTIKLKQEIVDSLIHQLEEAYPHEGCGLIIGSHHSGPHNESVTGSYYLPSSNTQADNRERRFLIDPMFYQHAEDRADEEGLQIISVVHSHPDHPDRPSEFDRLHAWPGLSYIIVSVEDGKAARYRSWRLTDDRLRFNEESILEY